MNLIKKIPLEISSLIFSLALLGSDFASFSKKISFIYTIIAFVLLIALTIRIFSNIRRFFDEIDDPSTLALFATYPFSIMILSMWVNTINPYLGYIIWLVGVIIYLALVILFTAKYVFKFSLDNVGAGWFAIYSGIIILSLTCPLYMSKIIPTSFWIGCILTIILFPYVYTALAENKFLVRRNDIVALTFPIPLMLLGCIYIYQDKIYILNNILILLSHIIYVYVIFRLLQIILMRKKFNYNMSIVTFPMLVIGLAMKMQVSMWNNLGQNINSFDKVYKVELAIAIILIAYISLQYIISIKNHRQNY